MLLRYMKVLATLSIGLASQLGSAETSSAQQNSVTAIDIALEPDATMIQHAEAVNARLLARGGEKIRQIRRLEDRIKSGPFLLRERINF